MKQFEKRFLFFRLSIPPCLRSPASTRLSAYQTRPGAPLGIISIRRLLGSLYYNASRKALLFKFERRKNMKEIKAILLGCGMVGSGIVKESYKRGVNYMAVFDVNPALIGKDIGEVIDEGQTGIMIHHIDELEAFLKKNKPEIAIDMATADTNRTLPQIKLLLSTGVNVLVSLADAYVRRLISADVYGAGRSCKANGVIILHREYRTFLDGAARGLTGCSLGYNQIKGTNVALIDYFGPGVADECNVGWGS